MRESASAFLCHHYLDVGASAPLVQKPPQSNLPDVRPQRSGGRPRSAQREQSFRRFLFEIFIPSEAKKCDQSDGA